MICGLEASGWAKQWVKHVPLFAYGVRVNDTSTTVEVVFDFAALILAAFLALDALSFLAGPPDIVVVSEPWLDNE